MNSDRIKSFRDRNKGEIWFKARGVLTIIISSPPPSSPGEFEAFQMDHNRLVHQDRYINDLTSRHSDDNSIFLCSIDR